MARRRKPSGDILTAVTGFVVAMYFWQAVIAVLVVAAVVWLIVMIVRGINHEITRRQTTRRRHEALQRPLVTISTYTPPPVPNSPPAPGFFCCGHCRAWLPPVANFCHRCGTSQA